MITFVYILPTDNDNSEQFFEICCCHGNKSETMTFIMIKLIVPKMTHFPFSFSIKRIQTFHIWSDDVALGSPLCHHEHWYLLAFLVSMATNLLLKSLDAKNLVQSVRNISLLWDIFYKYFIIRTRQVLPIHLPYKRTVWGKWLPCIHDHTVHTNCHTDIGIKN